MDCIKMVVTMNPCPCGYYPDMNRCRCTPGEVVHYLGKISQPLLDRIDLCADVPPVNFRQLSGKNKGECSADIRERVRRTREIQDKRYAEETIRFNGELGGSQIEKYCTPDEKGRAVLEQAFEKLPLSARAYHRILKVSRTIADMEMSEQIGECHIREALSYRSFDKKYWN